MSLFYLDGGPRFKLQVAEIKPNMIERNLELCATALLEHREVDATVPAQRIAKGCMLCAQIYTWKMNENEH